jgi:hypothetical protein
LFDTVIVGFHLSPTSQQLEEWDRVKIRQKHYMTYSSHYKYETWLRFNKGNIHVVYYPQDEHNEAKPLLLFEMSLPKLVYGDNIHMIFDPGLAIEKANQIIRQHSYMPIVDLNQGILYRIDLCFNILLGDSILEWIQQLLKLEYPRRKTKPYYPSEGVQYYSRRATLSFYGKEAESKNPDAHGILRMEASWRGKNRIEELVGKSDVMIAEFNSELAVSLLIAELAKLGIKDRAPVDSHATLRILVKKYGSEQGVRLYGFMNAIQIASSSEMKAIGMTKQTISRNRKQIRDAGLSMCIAENDYALPKLVINPRSTLE